MINCTFTGNVAIMSGGAMSNIGNNPPTIINCTFSGNSVTSKFGLGGGIVNCSSNPTVINSILWGNSSPQILEGFQSETTVLYSDIQGGWPGIGNIDADPLFVDPDNFRLSPGSPCIDAGDNTAVPGDITTDLDGNPRFVDDPDTPDTGNGEPPIVDMGAYELQAGADDDDDSSSDSSSDDSSSSDSSSDDSSNDDSTSDDSSSDDSSSDDSSSGGTAADSRGVPQASVPSIPEDVASCPKDINRDGIVNVVDLGDLLLCFGRSAVSGCESEDVNADGSVDVLDLLDLLLAVGTTCP